MSNTGPIRVGKEPAATPAGVPGVPARAGGGHHPLTDHARRRMGQRCLSPSAVAAALDFGRTVRFGESEIYALGRKEVRRLAAEGIDVSAFEGVRVVCSADGYVKTVYRDRDFRGLRPSRRKRGKWLRARRAWWSAATAGEASLNGPWSGRIRSASPA